MERMSEAYDEIFLKTGANSIIPAIRYLIMIRDEKLNAIRILDRVSNIEYPFIVDKKACPELMLQKAKEYQMTCFSEMYAAEMQLCKLIREGIECSRKEQMDYLGFAIEIEASEIYELVLELEAGLYLEYVDDTDEYILAKFIKYLSYYDFDVRGYDELYEYDYNWGGNPPWEDSDNNELIDSATLEQAIETVEDYLDGLRDDLEEVRKEEARNADSGKIKKTKESKK